MDNNSPSRTTEGPIIIENDGYPSASLLANLPSDDELSPILGAPPPGLPAAQPTESQPLAADPEFDAYMAVVKLIIGGAVEGAAELVKRLERWEAELEAAEDTPGQGEINTPGDVVRYMLVGMALSAGDGLRQQALRLAQGSEQFWRATGNATRPLVKNRLTGVVMRPIDRAFDRLVASGQKRADAWVDLGRAQEPGARRIARKAYLETIDEFIGLLAENQELADLVQNQSVGLATEAVDEFRSRTVSADAIAENIVRRILRRPPRAELPAPSDEVRQTILDHNIQTAGRPQAGP